MRLDKELVLFWFLAVMAISTFFITNAHAQISIEGTIEDMENKGVQLIEVSLS